MSLLHRTFVVRNGKFGDFMRAWSALALLLALAVIYGVALFNHGPILSIELRFAEAVREMFARGAWLMSLAHGN